MRIWMSERIHEYATMAASNAVVVDRVGVAANVPHSDALLS